MEEFEGRRRIIQLILTTGVWCNPVSNMLHHVQKRLSRDGQERFENVGSVLGWNPGRSYTGGRLKSTVVDALPSGDPFSRLVRKDMVGVFYRPPTGGFYPPSSGGMIMYLMFSAENQNHYYNHCITQIDSLHTLSRYLNIRWRNNILVAFELFRIIAFIFILVHPN